MSWIVIGARVLLALPFLIFGLDGLLEFLPRDVYPEHGEQAAAFHAALVDSGYAWELLKGVEVLVSIALLTGRFVPLALAVITPVVVHILGFHATMEREGTELAVVLVALTAFLAWAYRAHFRPMLAPHAKPFA
ncbi:MAG: DoxX family protein [Myxococcota bacterium]